ncbi:hypothetical protein L915_19241 [Phytophthora nicotianae]|uniref:Core-binding (CB) domain-containing protein n=1 Tax=Phytophthora nicotianae TaxID=4792 RepID=W2FSW1_PHYNI|nr:hypothetical protein L915_19241 [Phytophthora nicotianae]
MPTDFEYFLLEKTKTVRISTLNSYRSALKDLYRRKEVPLPSAYDKSLTTFFSGLKRLQADKYQSGSPKDSDHCHTHYINSYVKLRCCARTRASRISS